MNEVVWRDPALLLEHPDNWRFHPEAQMEALMWAQLETGQGTAAMVKDWLDLWRHMPEVLHRHEGEEDGNRIGSHAVLDGPL